MEKYLSKFINYDVKNTHSKYKRILKKNKPMPTDIFTVSTWIFSPSWWSWKSKNSIILKIDFIFYSHLSFSFSFTCSFSCFLIYLKFLLFFTFRVQWFCLCLWVWVIVCVRWFFDHIFISLDGGDEITIKSLVGFSLEDEFRRKKIGSKGKFTPLKLETFSEKRNEQKKTFETFFRRSQSY